MKPDQMLFVEIATDSDGKSFILLVRKNGTVFRRLSQDQAQQLGLDLTNASKHPKDWVKPRFGSSAFFWRGALIVWIITCTIVGTILALR